MAEYPLAVYLNDHLSGAVAALELLGHLKTAHAGTPLEAFLAGLTDDIAADRQELETLMGRLQIAPSRTRRVAAWLAEKGAELKLRLDDPAAGALRLLESLDILATGIEGKRSLWRALAAAAESQPGLQGTDYGRLERRAAEQRDRVEVVRLEAARSALSGPPATARP